MSGKFRLDSLVCLGVSCLLLVGGSHALGRDQDPPARGKPRGQAQWYSIDQAISDQAQLHTIAFSGLAFITGDFGASTFLPPGKVCDYFGFQYMRDIDAQGSGHNPKFLNRVAGNVLATLTDEQKQVLVDLAREQAPKLNELANLRLPLIKAFHRQLDRDIPKDSAGLNQQAVTKYVGDLFELDAKLSLDRVQAYGKIISTLTSAQRDYFSKMKFGDFTTWPDKEGNDYRLPRGTEKMVNVAYMTYASEFFSWFAGSVEADTYFCPERHATYFGGFYMKDMPAMGKKDFDISTSLTGDSGRAFLDLLNPEQRKLIDDIPAHQRDGMKRIVAIRRSISTEMRKLIDGGVADEKRVLQLGREYGELDGALSYECAAAFAKVGNSLSPAQRDAAKKLRNLDHYVSAPAYLYSTALKSCPDLGDTDRFFFPPKASEQKR